MDAARAQSPFSVARALDLCTGVTLATALVAACAGSPSRSSELPSISTATLAGHWKLTAMIAPSGHATRIEGATQEIQIDGDLATWTSGNEVCHAITSGIPIRRVDGAGLVLALSAGRRRCGPAPCVSRYRALPKFGSHGDGGRHRDRITTQLSIYGNASTKSLRARKHKQAPLPPARLRIPHPTSLVLDSRLLLLSSTASEGEEVSVDMLT
jgi:hypothetical protein